MIKNAKKEIALIRVLFAFLMVHFLALSIFGNKVTAEEQNKFGDWQRVCNEKACSILSFGVDPAGEKKARVSVSLSESGENGKIAEMTILSPLYSYLPHGLITAIQNNKPIRHEFTLCATEGCFNFIPLAKEDIDLLKKEWNLVIAYQNSRLPNEKVVVDVSLVGFKKAFESISD